jgi:hypothetical protein
MVKRVAQKREKSTQFRYFHLTVLEGGEGKRDIVIAAVACVVLV